jgi:2'-5' RNA ligase
MAEIAASSPLCSVQILLPEAVDRRLARWAKDAPGASWPPEGGHITLIPTFVQRGRVDEIRSVAESECASIEPFIVRLAEPVAVQDRTRQNYFALFLSVESIQKLDEPKVATEEQPLSRLREALLAALEPLRADVHPQLVEQAYLPHITLALGLGESEARKLVRELRAQPITANFIVDTVWLIAQGANEAARTDRYPLPLAGKPADAPR